MNIKNWFNNLNMLTQTYLIIVWLGLISFGLPALILGLININRGEQACQNSFNVSLNELEGWWMNQPKVECNNKMIGEVDEECLSKNKWGNCVKSIWVVKE